MKENLIRETFGRIEIGVSYIGRGALVVMMGLISFSAAGRYLFSTPIPGALEIVELYLMTALIFFSISNLQYIDGNIDVDVLSRYFSNITKKVIRLFGRSAVLIIFVAIVWKSGDYTWSLWQQNATTAGLISFPVYVSWAFLPIGFGLLCIRLIIQIVTGIRDIQILLTKERGSSVGDQEPGDTDL